MAVDWSGTLAHIASSIPQPWLLDATNRHANQDWTGEPVRDAPLYLS
ncbi:hypothetical protein [Kamptonema formosum]|nr:hypothetical protein [Oscillatoria sp. PCC 10802]